MKRLVLVGMLWAAGTQTAPQGVPAEAAPAATIVVDIRGLRSDDGGVLVNLYSSADGFPSKSAKAAARRYLKPNGHVARASFERLAYHEYAIAVCHDENANRDCDTNFLGIPKEGVGVSNDAKGFMGPPRFEDAMFKLDAATMVVRIGIRY